MSEGLIQHDMEEMTPRSRMRLGQAKELAWHF